MATRKSQTTKQQSKLNLIEVTDGKQTLKVQKAAIPFGFAPVEDKKTETKK
ncbi:hypothetical protein [Terribacillus saccharophilus]|uniref:hypothetical protein n=1 Tax=Terribacillus saccharophilus TaxID=361277 RepID=UPI00159628F3|nr:hypothetical protein [Terribacillus saccharophilus]